MARTKTSTRDDTKTSTTSWRNRHLENIYFCVFRIFLFLLNFSFYWLFLKGILQEMSSYRLGTVNDFHWGFKPVLSYSKPHTFSTSLGKEKERKNAFNLSSQAVIRYTVYYIYYGFFYVQNNLQLEYVIMPNQHGCKNCLLIVI